MKLSVNNDNPLTQSFLQDYAEDAEDLCHLIQQLIQQRENL